MGKIEINEKRCKGCELCVFHCPQKLIQMKQGLSIRGVHPAFFEDADGKCTGCAHCALICPDICIEVYR